ncbi:hypothetical protein [Nocardia brasiliensis]|uniref:hypothetical protein n=1 Tax=Nocardia brasiliensis TaxID=37326 RepID=UPI0018955FBC|nr:hypothetical protein [Nocardia brasiliensis]MBF6548879.1 hypothetical protein [Nocardia brasiliensis]
MARERVVDVIVPIVPPSEAGGSSLGVVAAMFTLFGLIVLVAVGACVVVSTTDFGPGPVIPSGPGCYPFCPPASTVPGPVGQVAR